MALRILEGLATNPVLILELAARRHVVSATSAHRALVELADAGVLVRTAGRQDQAGLSDKWTLRPAR